MKNLILLSVLLLVVGVSASAQNNVPSQMREMARKVMMPFAPNHSAVSGS